jgi:hypothetical protein
MGLIFIRGLVSDSMHNFLVNTPAPGMALGLSAAAAAASLAAAAAAELPKVS